MNRIDVRPDREILQTLLTDPGRAADPRAWQEYLCAFHEAVPHSGVFDLFHNAGRTSGDILIERVQHLTSAGGDVLDIGCGEGQLTRRLRAECKSLSLVAGIDVAASSLQRARERAGAQPVDYLEGSADALPFEENHFDVVTAHLVLMLVQPVAPALAEVRRVLRPGGHALFVVDLSEQACGAFARLRGGAMEFLRASFPNFVEPRLGDPRAKDRALLTALFNAAGLGRDLEVTDFEVAATMTPQRACELLRSMYVFGSLDSAREAALHATLLAQLKDEADDSGAVSLHLPMRLIAARR